MWSHKEQWFEAVDLQVGQVGSVPKEFFCHEELLLTTEGQEIQRSAKEDV